MNQELARQLCLKMIYGGKLTSEENLLFESFTQTAAGQQYFATSQEMKAALDNIAHVELTSVAKSVMIERFTKLLQKNAAAAQKRFPLALWLLIGPLGVLALLSGLTFGGNLITVLILSVVALFIILLAIMRNHHRQLQNETNLFQRMKTDHCHAQKLSNRVLAILIFLIPSIGGGWIFYQLHGITAGMKHFSLCLSFSLLITWLLIRISNKSVRSQDPEVWDWWQEELRE
ncbi:MAG: hypothetical protein MK165_02410 [Pirellulaceae bacterium]|nr:hypothetical protein [Pirellulaceae bacterium]